MYAVICYSCHMPCVVMLLGWQKAYVIVCLGYRYVGLWQTNVLSLDLATPPGVLRPEVSKPVVRFLFGDDSSARTQVDVPYNQRSAAQHKLA